MPAVEVGSRHVCDEELAASGVFAVIRHDERAAHDRPPIDLRADGIARAAIAVAAWIAALDEAVRDHSMEG